METDQHSVIKAFDAILSELSSMEGPEAAELRAQVEENRKNAEVLLTSKIAAAREKQMDKAKKKQEYVMELAFIDGDPEKGFKGGEITLTEADLKEMHDLGIRFSYRGDVMLGLSALNNPSVRFTLPNGQTGALFVDIDENGRFFYDFRKDFRKEEEKPLAA